MALLSCEIWCNPLLWFSPLCNCVSPLSLPSLLSLLPSSFPPLLLLGSLFARFARKAFFLSTTCM